MSIEKQSLQKQQTPFLWRLVIATTLLNLMAYGLVAWMLHQSRLSHHERAEATSQNIARLLERNVSDMIEIIETNLYAISDEVTRQKAAGGMDDAVLKTFLKRLHIRFPDIGSIRVVSADGTITHGSGKTLFKGANVADREYFQFLRDHPDAGTFVSKPMLGRTSGEWILIFSKRINNPDGSFGGVVNGTIELSGLSWMFSAVDVGSKGAISLRDEALGMIVRYPEMKNTEQASRQGTLSPHLQELLRSNKQYATIVAKSSIDGIERIISVRRVGKYPLYVIVGLAPEDYYVNWWQAVIKAGFALVIFSFVTVVMSILLYRSWVERLMLIEKLDRSQKLFHSMAEMSADWFWVQDKNFRFIQVTDDVTEKYGLSPEEFNGKTRWDVGIDKSEEEWGDHKACLESHQPFQDFEYCFLNDAGERRCISVCGEPVFDDDGCFAGYRGVGRDITEKKRYEERIEQMAQYDNLTGLPNRALFYDRLAQAVSIARREQREFALLYFDLDRFKPVNDQYGHAAGDQLLQTVASRIRYLLRESDTVARLGGDEFAVLLPTITSSVDAEEVAQKILSAVTSPYALDGLEAKITVGVSIGICLYPKNGASGDSLIKSADAAMYQSKHAGGGYSFSPEMAGGTSPSVAMPEG